MSFSKIKGHIINFQNLLLISTPNSASPNITTMQHSVQLLRRIDTRIPSPLLSTYIASTPPPPSLGKLANLRTIRGGTSPSLGAPTPSNASSASSSRAGNDSATLAPSPQAPILIGNQRGWASVIAKPPASAAIKSQSTSSTPVQDSLAGSAGSRVASPAPLSTGVDYVPDNWEEDT